MIVQGSNGVVIKLFIHEDRNFADLTNANVSMNIRSGTREFTKPATIIGQGTVEATLTSDDLATAGVYFVQATVVYNGGQSSFNSDICKFMVGAKM